MFEKYDSVIGVTAESSSKGTFVDLVDGYVGWISKKYIPKGMTVMCTVCKVKEDGFPILSLDSIRYAEAM